MALTFEIAGGQIDGARDYQEDAFLITHLSDSGGKPSTLVVVADGMGGHAAGNVASNMAVQAFNKYVSTNYPSEYVNEVLNGAVQKANHSIAETIKETPALDGMGCTMVAAIVEEKGIWWASVGDSHLYLVRDRQLMKINADHSYGGFLDAMAKAGTPVEPEPGLSRNMLMSAITGAEISEIDCPDSPMTLQHGDKILICSDGMDTLSEGKIIQYIDWSDTPKECSEALLNAVEEAGMPKQDNTTAVVVKVVDKAAEASAAAAEPEEDDDDEDITDTSGFKKPDLDKTADIADVEAAPEAAPEPPPQPPTPAPAPEARLSATVADEESISAREEKGGSKGIIFGIAAVVIIALAVGGYFIFVGKKSPPSAETAETGEMTESVTETAPAETEQPAAETTTAPTEAAPVETTEAAAPEETKPAEAKTETAAEAAPEPNPAAAAKPAETKQPKEFTDTLKDGSKGPEMVVIPAGTYNMGSPNSVPNADERPRHEVTFKKFAISKYEITFTQYDQYAKATGKKLPDNLYMERDVSPVIFVSWDDAYNYAKWLSKETGKKYRLPSEAEWEYAASGGKETPFWWGFNEEPGKAHCITCDSQFDPRKPTKIGSFKPNQFDLYDTAGNVAEWVHDCWHDNYKGAPADGSVWEGGDCTLRIARGGSFNSPESSIRTAKRDKFRSDSGYDIVGIRLVRELE